MAQKLAKDLNGRVVCDPTPDATPSSWRSYAECIRVAEGPTVILQDDVIAGANMLAALEQIHARHHGELVAGFHTRYPAAAAPALAKAAEQGSAYARLPVFGAYLPSVCLLWPARLIDLLKDWRPVKERVAAADDAMLAMFCRRVAYVDSYLATVPSLVEHPDSVPSLMGTSRRQSRSALHPPGDLASVDWTTDPVTW